MRKPGHETCHTCRVCGLGWCPDCDDEGRTCMCVGWGSDMETTGNSVDIPFYRSKPRRRVRDRGSSAVEYALLAALLAVLLLGALSFRGSLTFDIGDLDAPTIQQSSSP